MKKPKFSKGKWSASERGAYTDFDGNSRVISNSDKRLVVVQHHGSEEDEANTLSPKAYSSPAVGLFFSYRH